jgi:hydrogenase-4 component F
VTRDALSPAFAVVLALAFLALLRRRTPGTRGSDRGPAWAVALAAALVVLAILIAPREPLALALGCVLVALVTLATRPSVVALGSLGGGVALVAVVAATTGAAPWHVRSLADPLALHMAVLTTLAAIVTAPAALTRGLAFHAAFLAALLLALLVDSTLIAWAGMAAAVAVLVIDRRAAGDAAGGGRLTLAGGGALGLALVGVLLLVIAAPAGTDSWRWSVLSAEAARLDARLLPVAFAFLILGLSAVVALMPAGGMALPGVALATILRARSIVAANPDAVAPGPMLLTLGLLTLLLTALASRRAEGEHRAAALAGLGQLGVVAFAFGLGTEAAMVAGVLHLTLLALTRASLALEAGGGAAAAGLVALAGLPPFGLFASLFLIMTETARRAPWLAVPLGLGLSLTAWALAPRILAAWRRAPMAGVGPATVVAWLTLAVVAALGLAMPPAAVAWFTAVARVAP